MPRLKRMWTHLSRQKKGVGLRGPGETQLEEDRRLVENRIKDLRRQLDAIERRKEREVAARRDLMTVSLVGYTNAGKSTLLNVLTGADVFVQDALFATLDTRTRRWQLPGWGPVLLSDTVGFIRDLPHHLIDSFKATLEEARQADLLLHVADAANPAVYDQIAAAYSVLEEIGIQQKDTLLVLNKVDALPDRVRLDGLLNRYPNAVPISARRGFGLDNLAAAVSEALSRSFLDVDVEIGVDNGRLLAFTLAGHGEVLSKQYHDSRVIVHCRIPQRALSHFRGPDTTIRPHGSASASREQRPRANRTATARRTSRVSGCWPVDRNTIRADLLCEARRVVILAPWHGARSRGCRTIVTGASSGIGRGAGAGTVRRRRGWCWWRGGPNGCAELAASPEAPRHAVEIVAGDITDRRQSPGRDRARPEPRSAGWTCW